MAKAQFRRRHRTFGTRAAAEAYDQGYADWPEFKPAEDVPASYSTGYFDKEREEELKLDARRDKAKGFLR